MGLEFSKDVQNVLTLETKTKIVCLFLVFVLKLQHENDKMKSKSIPSPWFIGLSKFSPLINLNSPQLTFDLKLGNH